MRNMTKRALSIMLAATTLMFTMISAFAAPVTQSTGNEEIVVYLNKDFSAGKGMTINGNVYSASGNAIFDSSKGNTVNGSIILSKKGFYLEENEKVKPTITGEVKQIENTTFDYKSAQFPVAPVIKNVINNCSTGNSPLVVDKNTYFKQLTVDSKVQVDTSKGNVTVVVDKLDLKNSGTIEIIGDGHLTLFVNGTLNMKKNNAINHGGDSKKVNLVVKGNINLGMSSEISANVFVDDNTIKLVDGGVIKGNISSNARTFVLSDDSSVQGLVYVPFAKAVVKTSGKIIGKLIANSLDITAQGEIILAPVEESIINPPEPVAKYKLNILSAVGGTVSPKEGLFAADEKINITISPDAGYKFVRFENASIGKLYALNDDGTLSISYDVTLMPIFEKTPEVPEVVPPVNDIPVGEPVYINFKNAYLYGYEHGDVGANDNIKREEAVALLYRLLKQDNQLGDYVAGPSTFTDVSDTRWSKNALMYMKHIGVYKNDYVNPHHAITRGEVAKIICFALRLNADDAKTMNFADLPLNHKDYWYIKALVDAGIMKGYDDGIHPDVNITRAEYIVMLNRLLGRDETCFIDNQAPIYSDLTDKGFWAYGDLMRASFGFTDAKVDGFYQIDPARKPSRYSIDYN